MKKVVVIIPVYKAEPTALEALSFRRCLKVLGRYPIVMVGPDNLSFAWYQQEAAQVDKKLELDTFAAAYFTSVEGYNALMLSEMFYKRFADYEYMLIYQLDALVFSDQLEEWCNKGYDYVGAPIHYRDKQGKITDRVWGVGNGGLCLRRVQYCLHLLSQSKHRPFMGLRGLCNRYEMKWHSYLGLLPRLLGQKNTLGYFLRKQINEDLLFSVYAKHSFVKANIPTVESAREFSIESFPSHFFPHPEEHLPFGCHAFDKNEYENYWSHVLKRL